MDQQKIRILACGMLLTGLCALGGTGFAQLQPTTAAEAAHHVVEQELQSYVPGQVVYAQKGLVVRSRVIREGNLILHYPQVRVVGKQEVSQKISRYFEKQANVSRENYDRANTMEEKLTSRVDYQVSYHGERDTCLFRPMDTITLNGPPIPPAGNWERPLICRRENWYPGRKSSG